MTALGCLCCFIGLVPLCFGIRGAIRAEQIRRYGIAAAATVEDKQRKYSGGEHGSPFPTHHVTVTFRDRSGTILSGEQQVSGSFYDAVQPGREVRVKYLPSGPGGECARSLLGAPVLQIHDDSGEWPPGCMIVLGAAIVVLGVALLVGWVSP
jgi:hypothetical protein